MKRFFRTILVALMSATLVTLTSCNPEERPNPGDVPTNPPTYSTLERTEWEGAFSTTTQTSQGNMALIIRWTLDFLANGQASVMMVFESQAFDNTPFDWTSSYTYDPATGNGVLTDENLGTVNFSVDAVNRTMTADLIIYVQHEEGGSTVGYGGTTTLHQTH